MKNRLFIFWVVALFEMLMIPFASADSLEAFTHDLQNTNLYKFALSGESVTRFIFEHLPRERPKSNILSFAYAWENLELNRELGSISQSEVPVVSINGSREPILESAMRSLISIAKIHNDLIASNGEAQTLLHETALGIVHNAMGSELQDGRQFLALRTMVQRSAMFPMRATCSEYCSNADFAYAVHYLLITNYPADAVEQVWAGLRNRAAKSNDPELRRYFDDLGRTFVRYTIPRLTDSTMFRNLDTSIRFKLVDFALDGYSPEIGTSV